MLYKIITCIKWWRYNNNNNYNYSTQHIFLFRENGRWENSLYLFLLKRVEKRRRENSFRSILFNSLSCVSEKKSKVADTLLLIQWLVTPTVMANCVTNKEKKKKKNTKNILVERNILNQVAHSLVPQDSRFSYKGWCYCLSFSLYFVLLYSFFNFFDFHLTKRMRKKVKVF